MKLSAWAIAVVLIGLLAVTVNSQEAAGLRSENDTTTGKIKDLQQQRISTLKDLVEGLNAERLNGRGSFEELIEANVQLLNAELEIAATDAERLKLRESIVKQFATLEDQANAARNAARGSYSGVLKAKARRLEAEIQLERAKTSLAK